jgi:hypothetical protein
MRGSKALRRHLEAESWVARMAESSGQKRRCGCLRGVRRKGNELTGGARELVIGERRGGLAKCATPRRKCNPAITPRRFGPTRLAKEAAAHGGRVGRCGRTGPAGPGPRGDSDGNLIFEFHRFLEFGKTLRNSTMRFRRNLGMGIFFLNSSRLLKDF